MAINPSNMNKGDIALLKCYSENFKHNTISENYEPAQAFLKISFRDYRFKDTYLLTINIDTSVSLNHKEVSLSTFTEFSFKYENFVPQLFYAREIDKMIELVNCAYNNARMLFYNEYKNIPGLEKFYLPFRFSFELKEWMATADVYNKL